MKKLITFIAALCSLASCTAVPLHKSTAIKIKRSQLVRLTVYWKSEDGWTRRGFTSTQEPLESYKTIAADPRDFPYYSKISIPEIGISGVIHDTGSALKTRKAARQCGKNVPVLDLYIEKKADAKKFLKTAPMFVIANVIE